MVALVSHLMFHLDHARAHIHPSPLTSLTYPLVPAAPFFSVDMAFQRSVPSIQ